MRAFAEVGYHWHLREVMAAHRMIAVSGPMPLLRDRGIELSVSQVHRPVGGIPERLSPQVLAALCDISECTPAVQADIDAWFAGHREHDHNCLRGFLTRAAADRLTGRHDLPTMQILAKAPLSEPERLALLRLVAEDRHAGADDHVLAVEHVARGAVRDVVVGRAAA